MVLHKVKPDDYCVTPGQKLRHIINHPTVEFSEYEKRLATQQRHLQRVQQAYLGTRERAIVVLEGWDTAGKGGLVRRIGWALDPRSFRVHPIAAPTGIEQHQHYLQRFWKSLPAHGEITAFDRTWYGRVLVERVEGFATASEWQRAYREINEFERMLCDDGVRLIKIFLHITPDEQVKRFKDRLSDPLKRWKLSYEDFRNRTRWSDYETAIEAMFEETSHKHSPWYLLPANNKPYARLAAFEILIDRMGAGLSLDPCPLDPKISEAAALLFGPLNQK